MTGFVVGTAGHIDHGKSALVRALTGTDPDRLPVEQARGITTELGFARWQVGGSEVAIVDVPGHERFVKSMVAGATGLDLALLVVAADAGVMPQTREHLDICDLLGVRGGVIAVTKTDLVDADWLALVELEIRAAVAGTRFADAPIVPVSARTGAGLDALTTALGEALAGLPPRPTVGAFRLPIDRVFSVRGFGTVVTGTILGGAVALGDELVALPAGHTSRARGLEVHGRPVARAVAGQRAAVNLAGLAVTDLARGALLAHPGTVATSHILDVELRVRASLPAPLPRRTKVLLHHATSQLLATLVLLDADELAPGGHALAQLRLPAATPLAALPGDAFLVRGTVASPSHGATLGGGQVIRVLAPRARGGGHHATVVAALAHAGAVDRLLLDIANAQHAGLDLAALAQRSGRPADQLARELAPAVAAGDLLAAGPHYFHARVVADLEARLLAALAGDELPREQLRGRLPAALPARAFDAIVDHLLDRRGLVANADRLRRALAPPRPALSALETLVIDRCADWGLAPPRPKELAAALARPPAAVAAAVDRLLAAGLLVRVKPDLFIETAALAALRERLLAFLAIAPTIDAQQWKDLTGTSRKYSIPLAEYFDAQQVTERIGDLRRPRRSAQKK